MRPLPPANPGLRSGHEVRPADLSPALLLLPGANVIYCYSKVLTLFCTSSKINILVKVLKSNDPTVKLEIITEGFKVLVLPTWLYCVHAGV